MIQKIIYIIVILISFLFSSCGGDKKSSNNQEEVTEKESVNQEVNPLENKGIGPISSPIKLSENIDQTLVEEGKVLYEKLCLACHKPYEKYIGPAPKNILDRRSPEWIMNMILNPEEMLKKDPIAKQLFIEYNGAPMANQNLTQEEARSILEYFRTLTD